MADYQKMYKLLFNAITDALIELGDGNIIDAEYKLKKSQYAAEEMFLNTEPNIQIVEIKKPK